MRFWLPLLAVLAYVAPAAADLPPAVRDVLNSSCVSCHGENGKGRLDLSALRFDPADTRGLERWAKVFDRVSAGEMPPKGKAFDPADRKQLTDQLGAALTAADAKAAATDGRAARRRLSRREYECVLRDLLQLSWLEIDEVLPEDGTAHHFAKSAEALDVSHVQMSRYLAAADAALRQAVAPAVAPERTTVRYYAREQNTFTRRMAFSAFNQAPERATFPTLGFGPQPDVRLGKQPMTVGAADPKTRELEGVGLVCGAYEPVEPKFDRFKAPMSGRYKLRLCGHSIWVGPNGRNNNARPGGEQWFIPHLDSVSKGRRDEPVALYSETPPRQMRYLGAIDLTPDPVVREMEVDLLAGETARPDAARLFRSRPGETRWHNPLAEKDGQPGVAYRWLEVEGPITANWPPPGHTLLFGDLPVQPGTGGLPQVVSTQPSADARRLLADFARRVYRRPRPEAELTRFLPLIEAELTAGRPFAEAMLTGYKAVLCSPEFLYTQEKPGRLDDYALAVRLSLFLWNSEPDAELRRLADAGMLHEPKVLTAQTERLLNDPRAGRFVNTFLDYWLELRRMGANNPDATLYNDYYLDDLLADSALAETRAFFAELLRADLPSRNLIASDFAMLNERLADHYGIPGVKGVGIRKVPLPADSVRGGLLTMASVLSITANGTSTSPVLRGAWITDRILGQPSPPPPPVPAVEPDLRGATTIREQLAKHRDQASCAACHSRIDPPGFALESFDVMGGFRERYRAVADTQAERVKGFGKNGQPFAFKDGKPVDASGVLLDGRTFSDVRAFKALLLTEERQVARNLARQLVVYATGAPVRFGDRAAIEAMLDKTKAGGYGVRGLVHAVVQSELFQIK